MSKKTRREIKEMFKAGSQPTGQDFSDFIDSITNSLDDGLTKPSEQYLPLRVESNGDEQNIFDFYDDDGIHCWRVNQYPTDSSVGGVSVQRAGLNIEDSNSETRLFIKQDNGDIGLGTVNPTAKLHVVQAGSDTDAFRVDDTDDDTTPFLLSGSGALNIRVNPEDYDESLSLNVSGPVRLVNTNSSTPSLEIYKGTDLTVDTDGDSIADKPEAALSVMKNGAVGIGTDAPDQGVLIKGDLKLADGLEVDGDTTINGNLTVQGNVYSKSVDETLAIRDVRLGDQDEDTVTVNGEIFSAHSTGSLCIKDSLNIEQRTIIGSSYYSDSILKLGSQSPADGLLVQGNVGIGFLSESGVFTPPEAKLCINGGLHVGGYSDPGDNNLYVDGNFTIDGKIGVGTTLEPTEKLEVIGKIKASDEIIAPNLNAQVQTTSPTVYSNQIKAIGTDGLKLFNTSSKGLFISDAGNVGFGTTDPDTLMHVKGSAKIDQSLTVSGLASCTSFQIGQTTVNQINTSITGNASSLSTDKAVKDYTDNQITELEADLEEYTDTKALEAKNYAETKDAALKTEVQDYAVTKVENLRTEVNGKGYATESYVDSKVGSLNASASISFGSIVETGYLNSMDEVLNYNVPEGYVMVGLYSYHSNDKEDRQWKIRYRSISVSANVG